MDGSDNCKAIDKKANQAMTNGEFTLCLDVSRLTGSYYIIFGQMVTQDYNGNVGNHYYSGSGSFKIDAIWY